MRLKALALLPLLAGCEHALPPASPLVPAGAPPPPWALHDLALPDSPGLDRLFDGMLALGAEKQLHALLHDFVRDVTDRDLAGNPAARRLVAHAVLRLSHAPEFMDHFATIRQTLDRMQRVVPDAPELRFCRAYLRWILLADGQGGLHMGELAPRVALDLRADLQFLSRNHPDWQAPGEFAGDRLRRELVAVEALIAGLPDAATLEATP